MNIQAGSKRPLKGGGPDLVPVMAGERRDLRKKSTIRNWAAPASMKKKKGKKNRGVFVKGRNGDDVADFGK